MCAIGVRAWDIVEEVVKYNVVPAPANPFAVDLDYFNGLPPLTKAGRTYLENRVF